MPTFLERRSARVVAPWIARIDYTPELFMEILRNPRFTWDAYHLFSVKKNSCILSVNIPKIPLKSEPGYFDMFGEQIEKTR